MPKTINNKKSDKTKLCKSLVLNRFIFSLFCTSKSIEGLSEFLNDPRYEGYDEDNVSNYYHAMADSLLLSGGITDEKLLEYDEHIFMHTEHINKDRTEKIRWKYFQYLSLLFAEIYLDRYFNGRAQLLEDLNTYLQFTFANDAENNSDVELFTPDDLNKLAFWNATGSGKTLLMHINILQYLYYQKQNSAGGNNKLNRIILLTPNEGLTAQHLDELHKSDIEAVNFSKDNGTMYSGQTVEVMEITKLGDVNGDKKVAVDAFEGNNLVIVDEGHRGASGDTWKRMRDTLAQGGFSFEYSATFGQSIGAATGGNKKSLLQEYAKATLFDYSYKHFYEDGYGKDFNILNLAKEWDEGQRRLYLTACMLSFYEQICLYKQKEGAIRPFLIEKPLAIFVGSSVTASVSDKEASDVVTILHFFQHFVDDSRESIDYIDRLMNGNDGLVEEKTNRSIFNRSFNFLREQGRTAQDIYADMLAKIFNSTVVGANLYVDNLNGQSGEIGMRVGSADYFGVINVGDDSKLMKILGKHQFKTNTKDFSDKSLFASINEKDSHINVLIGSKKFTEGWSSWRVATMGLMNIGVNEGSQIIQLFGRGVRLKGFAMSLKRSKELKGYQHPEIPQYLELLETLNIFGIHADYMEKFKDYLEEEGIRTDKEDDFEEIDLNTMLTINFGKTKLKYLKLKEGKDFKQDFPHLQLEYQDEVPVVTLNYYPRIQMRKSSGKAEPQYTYPDHLNEEKIKSAYMEYIDWDEVYFALQQYKRTRGWNNLSFGKDTLMSIMQQQDWYQLQIEQKEIQPQEYAYSVNLWQTLVISLLRLYVEAFYEMKKGKWTSMNLESSYLSPHDPNFIEQYKVMVNKELTAVIAQLNILKEELENKSFAATKKLDGASKDFEAIFIGQHLYQPLMYLNGDLYKTDDGPTITIKPVALIDSEKNFINTLMTYLKTQPAEMEGKELYLLRNQSKKGLGINDIYPDFILWIIDGAHQYVNFIEPHGLEHNQRYDTPKVKLYQYIMDEVQPRIADKDMTLNSFVISPTSYHAIKFWDTMKGMNEHHIYFQTEQGDVYMNKIVEQILNKH